MKYVIIMVILVCALTVSCVPVATKYICPDGREVADSALCAPKITCPDGSEVTDASLCPPKVEPVAPTPEVIENNVVIEKKLSEAAQALFDKSTKANDVKFNYYHSDDPYVQNRFYISRTNGKIELINKEKFTEQDMYDTVYLDFKNKIAVGYCERLSLDSCPDKNKKYTVSYERFKLTTPFDWLDQVEEADVTGRSKQLGGKTAKEMTFKIAGKDGTMWVDSFFGVPMVVNYDGITYEFQNILINDAKASDFVHQQV